MAKQIDTILIVSLVTMIFLASVSPYVNARTNYVTMKSQKAYDIYRVGNVIDLYLGDSIGSSDDYAELVHELKYLSAATDVNVYLYGHGGNMTGLRALQNSLLNTNANVTMHITSNTYSAHSMLACTAKRLVITPGLEMFFHPILITAQELKVTDLMDMYMSYMRQMRSLFSACIIRGIMTKEEVRKVMHGGDVYVPTDEIIKRLRGNT